ncbi:D-2-hydroxyacid dehydrogenase [Pseudomonadota bacterium]
MPNLLLYIDKLEHWPDRYENVLRERFPDISLKLANSLEIAHETLEDTDILVAYGESLSEQFLSKTTRVQWIHNLATGMDWTVNLPVTDAGPILTSTRGVHGAPVSEITLMMMLALARDFVQFLHNQRQRVWQRLPSQLLEDKSVGILGVGSIAESLAPKCKAMGMKVVGFSATRKSVENFDHIYPRDKLKRIATELDFLVLLTPLSKKTQHIIDMEVFRAMKPSAYLINVARGGIVDEEAMIVALIEKEIAGAALDVFATEPLPSDHPLWTMDNVIISPHSAGYYDSYVDKAAANILTENVQHFLAGEIGQMVNRYDPKTMTYPYSIET